MEKLTVCVFIYRLSILLRWREIDLKEVKGQSNGEKTAMSAVVYKKEG